MAAVKLTLKAGVKFSGTTSTFRLPFLQYCMTRQTFGSSMHTPKNCTRFSCFISFICHSRKGPHLTWKTRLGDVQDREYNAHHSELPDDWRFLEITSSRVLHVLDGHLVSLYGMKSAWSAVKLQASHSRSVLVKLLPGTGRWWCRCSPSLSYPLNHNCCWRNWTESCCFRSDWLCCSETNRELPGGNKHCKKTRFSQGDGCARPCIPWTPLWWWYRCSWSTTRRSHRASSEGEASAERGARCRKLRARPSAGRPQAARAGRCLRFQKAVSFRIRVNLYFRGQETLLSPLVSHSQSSLLKPHCGLSEGGFPFGHTTELNMEVGLGRLFF